MTRFPAKLILFGEYSILLGSSALGVPFNHFGASLGYIGHETGDALVATLESNRHLKRMCDFFLEDSLFFNKILDCDGLSHDILNGLCLNSTIPQRYGMGSSGVLCAAVYDAYHVESHDITGHVDVTDLVALRKIFIRMESFFHGRSSGFDPLVSWLKTPLLAGRDGELAPVSFSGHSLADEGIDLILVDSGKPCSTGPLVADFLAEFFPGGMITSAGADMCILVNSVIGKLLSGDPEGLWKAIWELSRFQLMKLNRPIPAVFIPSWEEGLQTGLFSLKLCGSGGGGFLLCLTRDKELTMSYFTDRHIPVIQVSL
ncbi:MAG: hypothetical protein NT040_12580 [Bacteroidetes bacterium]|nr:hypothetical protein [Bacteroidota bacterium]